MEKALKEILRVSKNNNICITFLKRSKKLSQFKELIKKHLKNIKEVEEEKDMIFISSFQP